MSSIKANLKAARDELAANNYERAVYFSEQVLDSDPANYNGLLLLGKALEFTGDFDRSEGAYSRATELQPLNRLAWKGLLVLFEQTKKLSKAVTALNNLAKCVSGSREENARLWDDFKKLRNLANRDPEANQALLEIQLPGTALFEALESNLPPPYKTLSKLISAIQDREADIINKAISKHKFRLNANKSDSPSSLKYKVYTNSKIPYLLEELLNWTPHDDQRREAEGKLLKYLYETLLVSPHAEKTSLKDRIYDLAAGMTVVDSPEPLAWRIYMEWSDAENLKDLEYNNLLTFIEKFPSDGLSRVLSGYLHSEISAFERKTGLEDKEEKVTAKSKPEPNDDGLTESISNESEDQEGEDEIDTNVQQYGEVWPPDVVIEVMTEGYELLPDNVIILRILSSYYLHNKDYETAADIAQKGLRAIEKLHADATVELINGRKHLSLVLASAYIYYEAPKNFDTALKMFSKILRNDPHNLNAKIGKGLISMEKGDLQTAEKLLKSVSVEFPDNIEAKFELSWCYILSGRNAVGEAGLKQCLELVTGGDPVSLDLRAQIWWRLGESMVRNKSKSETQDISAFDAFINALRQNPNYAAAYTSLGKLYAGELGDDIRATKCFYKAFELDAGEIEAAEMLASEFAKNMDWDLVEVVATRVLESDRLRTYSGRGNRDRSWPYRALGIVGLLNRDYAKVVQYFQSALRISPKDANSWVGLGEAYTNNGRYFAATKAFTRAMELDPANWVALFQLGIVQREVHEFDKSMATFEKILEQRPEEIGVIRTYAETMVIAARHFLKEEYYGRSADIAQQAVSFISQVVIKYPANSDIWKALAESNEILLQVGTAVNSDESIDIAGSLSERPSNIANGISKVLESMEKSLQEAVSPGAKAAAWYNLGAVYLKLYLRFQGERDFLESSVRFINSSISSLKKAIHLESRNFEYWNAYGVACSFVNSRVAHHSFIRSLSLNHKQPQAWTNLAAFYMKNGDLELAMEALDKSVSQDPDFAPAWIGYGILSAARGNKHDANNYFDHSNVISSGTDVLAKLLFGLSVLERAVDLDDGGGVDKTNKATTNQELAIMGLQKYQILRPESELCLSTITSLLERESDYYSAVENATILCKVLEDAYEMEESQDLMERYAMAKAQLSRLYLALGNFNDAVENSDISSGLLQDVEVNTVTSALSLRDQGRIQLTRLSAFLTAGLAHYFSGDFDQSIDGFKQALVESEEDQDVVVLLAQVLWAHGEKGIAVDQLYSSLETKGTCVRITLLLGVLGIIDSTTSLLEAVEDELQNLPLELLIKDTNHDVQRILSEINNRTRIKSSRSPWQRAAFFWPSEYSVWRFLQPQTALAITSNTHVTSEQLHEACLLQTSTIDCQRAIFYAPWKRDGWKQMVSLASN